MSMSSSGKRKKHKGNIRKDILKKRYRLHAFYTRTGIISWFPAVLYPFGFNLNKIFSKLEMLLVNIIYLCYFNNIDMKQRFII